MSANRVSDDGSSQRHAETFLDFLTAGSSSPQGSFLRTTPDEVHAWIDSDLIRCAHAWFSAQQSAADSGETVSAPMVSMVRIDDTMDAGSFRGGGSLRKKATLGDRLKQSFFQRDADRDADREGDEASPDGSFSNPFAAPSADTAKPTRKSVISRSSSTGSELLEDNGEFHTTLTRRATLGEVAFKFEGDEAPPRRKRSMRKSVAFITIPTEEETTPEDEGEGNESPMSPFESLSRRNTKLIISDAQLALEQSVALAGRVTYTLRVFMAIALLLDLFCILFAIAFHHPTAPLSLVILGIIMDVVYTAEFCASQFQRGILSRKHTCTDRVMEFFSSGAALDVVARVPLYVLYPPAWRSVFIRVNRLLVALKSSWLAEELIPDRVHPFIRRMVLTLLWFVYIVHFFACAHAVVNDAYNDEVPGRSDSFEYFAYFNLSVNYLVGFSSIPFPAHDGQYALHLCHAITGLVLFALVINFTGSGIKFMAARETELSERIDSVRGAMSHLNLPPEFQNEVVAYYRATDANGQRFDLSQSREIIEDLPVELQVPFEAELAGQLIRQISFFASSTDLDFLRELRDCLRPLLAMPGSHVAVAGDPGEDMFVLLRGEAELRRPDGTVEAKLSDGGSFGEVSLLFDIPHPFDAFAVTVCNFYVLSREPLEPLVDRYPEAFENVLNAAMLKTVNSLTATALGVNDAMSGGPGENSGEGHPLSKHSSLRRDSSRASLLPKKPSLLQIKRRATVEDEGAEELGPFAVAAPAEAMEAELLSNSLMSEGDDHPKGSRRPTKLFLMQQHLREKIVRQASRTANLSPKSVSLCESEDRSGYDDVQKSLQALFAVLDDPVSSVSGSMSLDVPATVRPSKSPTKDLNVSTKSSSSRVSDRSPHASVTDVETTLEGIGYSMYYQGGGGV